MALTAAINRIISWMVLALLSFDDFCHVGCISAGSRATYRRPIERDSFDWLLLLTWTVTMYRENKRKSIGRRLHLILVTLIPSTFVWENHDVCLGKNMGHGFLLLRVSKTRPWMLRGQFMSGKMYFLSRLVYSDQNVTNLPDISATPSQINLIITRIIIIMVVIIIIIIIIMIIIVLIKYLTLDI